MPLSAQQLAAQKNLSYVLAEKLAQRILKGEYEPGTILPGEIELGEQFGVSRTAVREAVKTLTAKGMVLPRPRIGTRVMPQSNWNFLDQELLTWWMTEENFIRSSITFWLCVSVWSRKLAYWLQRLAPRNRRRISIR